MLPEGIRDKPQLVWARRCVWAYFIVLVLEVAFGRVLPEGGWEISLLGDALVLLTYFLAASKGAFPLDGFVKWSLVLAAGTATTAIFWGHGNALIALYGARTNFLYLPLVFVIPRLFTLEDVWRFGKVLLWLSLPLAVVTIALAHLPDLFGKASGVTVSSSAQGGFSCFWAMALAFVGAAFFQRKFYVLGLVTLGAFLWVGPADPTTLALCAWVVGFAAMMWVGTRIKGGAGIVLAIILVLGGLFFLPRQNREVLGEKLEQAAEVSGVKSVFESARDGLGANILEPLAAYKTVSALGDGTGIGTDMAIRLVEGNSQALLTEAEWSRLLLEGGYLWGTALILFRICLAGFLFYWAYRTLQTGNVLPGMLFAAALPLVLAGGWTDAAVLGFTALGAGFVLAATRPRCNDSLMLIKAAASIPKK
jgi:hypothetical protein